jgi:serine/threonine protein kinase/WD40 repeat protein
LQCIHGDGFVVVKVYFRRESKEFDSAQLKRYEARLDELATRLPLSVTPSVLNLVKLDITDRAVFLGRQYMGSSLVERFHSHPALHPIEKSWLTFQMLHAVHQLHSHGIRHGDIKTDNFLLTSWNWLFLVDVAFYKPTFLPSDNPADYNYFFENHGHTIGSHGMITQSARRRCYVAPERFYNQITDRKFLEPSGGGGGGIDGQVSEAMDIFSLGCVIAELFLNGEHVLFDLPALLAFRDGAYDPSPLISRIPFPAVRNLIHHMIQRDPAKRFSAKQYIKIWSRGGAGKGGGDELYVPPIITVKESAPATVSPSPTNTGTVTTSPPVTSPSLAPLTSPSSQPTISPSPAATPTNATHPHASALPGALFPPYFPYLYRFNAKLLNPELADPDIKIQALKTHQRAIIKEVLGTDLSDAQELPPVPTNGPNTVASVPTVGTIVTPKKGKLLEEFASFARSLELNTQSLKSLDALQAEVDTARRLADEALLNANSALGGRGGIGAAVAAANPYRQINQQPIVASPGLEGGASIQTPSSTPQAAASSLPTDSAISDGFSLDNSPSIGGGNGANFATPVSTSTAPSPVLFHGNGLTMITSVVCSCLQNVRYPITKLTALELLADFGQHVDDEVRLSRLVPYAVAMLTDASSMVRATSCHILTKLLSQVHSLNSGSDAHLFAEYVLPALSRFPKDSDEIVRLAYAQCIAELAVSSKRFLDLAQLQRQVAARAALNAMSDMNTLPTSPQSAPPSLTDAASLDESYNVELSLLQDTVLKLVIDMLTVGGSRVKRALLSDITRLCVFMGQARVNNELLPHLITVLNDRDWQLRSAFFEYISGVSVFVGRIAFQNFVLPCIEQALFDVEEFVIQRAVHALTALSQLGLFDTRTMLDIAGKVGPLLCHPSAWIRHEAVKFVASMATKLGLAKSHVFLVPLLRPFLRGDAGGISPTPVGAGAVAFGVKESQSGPRIVTLTQEGLVQALKPHLTREEFKVAVSRTKTNAATEEVQKGNAPAGTGGRTQQQPQITASIAPGGESYSVPSRLLESAVGTGMSWVDSSPSALTAGVGAGKGDGKGTMRPSPNQRQLSEQSADSSLSNSLSSSVGDDNGGSNGAGSNSGSTGGSSASVGGPRSSGTLSSGYKDDAALAPVMTMYLARVSAAMQAKSQMSSSPIASSGVSGGNTSLGLGPGGAQSALEQLSQSGPSALLMRAAGLGGQPPSSLQAMDEDSLLIELQNLTLSSSLETEIPLHQLEVERSLPETLVVGPAAGTSRAEQLQTLSDLYGDMPVHVAGGASGGGASDPSRRAALVAAAAARGGDPSVAPRTGAAGGPGSAALASASTAGVTAHGGHPIALKETFASVPEYVKRALGVPLPPPMLGALRPESISYSSFYKNHPVLDSAGYAYSDSQDPKLWRPKGVLVATLAEHKAAVSSLAVARDNLFLVSGSEDGCVKIWDAGRLKLTAHARSQWTHVQHGRITSVTVCDSSHSVASASSNGSLHVFKVDYSSGGGAASQVDDGNANQMSQAAGSGVGVPQGSANPATQAAQGGGPSAAQRYLGLTDIKRIDADQTGEGAMLSVAHFHTLSESLLVYATQKAVHGWDLRSRHALFELKMEPSWGVLTALSLGPTPYVLVTGTSRGFVAAWDLRFQIPVQVWRHSAKSAITHLTSVDALSILPRDNANPPSQGAQQQLQHPVKAPLIFAAAEGTNQISGFDIYTGENRMLLRVLNSTEQQGAGGAAASAVTAPVNPAVSPPQQLPNRRESISSAQVAAVAAAANSGPANYPVRSRQRVHVSPLSLPSLRSYMKESERVGSGLATAAFPPAYSASSGFYHSLLGVTLDDVFLREFASATPESLLVGGLTGGVSTGPTGVIVPPPPPPSIRSFLLCKESFVLTAGTDKVVRFWDLRDPADSYRISSADLHENDYLRYHSRVENSTVVLEEVLSNQPPPPNANLVNHNPTGNANNNSNSSVKVSDDPRVRTKLQLVRRTQGQMAPSTAHSTDILDMKAIEFPHKMLATAGRDGIIKVWI